jgi:hypothetical protein
MSKVSFFSMFVFAALIAVSFSCSTETTSVRVEKNVKTSSENGEQLPNVQADRLLVVELEGMVCEMGCGGSIRKELYASNAVENVSFDFDEDKTIDVARVAFNRDLITADEIVAIIAATNEGQFNVIRTRSEPYVKESETSDTAASSDAATTTSKVTVKTRSYASVSGGFFDLFSWL